MAKVDQGPFLTGEMVRAAVTDLPEGVDAVLVDSPRIKIRVEAAAYILHLAGTPLDEARRLAWRAAINRGHAKAVTGLASEGDH